MIKRFTIVFSLILIAVALSACLTVGSNPDKAVLSGEIPAGGTLTRTFRVPNDLQGDIIYFELDGDANGAGIDTSGISIASKLELTLFDATGKAVRFSNNAKFFSDISNAGSISTTGIVVDPKKDTCRGPCIIFEYDPATLISGDGQVKIKVKNNNNSAVNYKLYAFIAKYTDSNEPNNSVAKCTSKARPANGDVSPAIVVDPKLIDVVGSIETVEDKDCFTTSGVVSKITIETASENTVGLTAVIKDKNTNATLSTLNLAPGGHISSFNANNKEVFIIIGSNNGKAAPAKYSKYKLSY